VAPVPEHPRAIAIKGGRLACDVSGNGPWLVLMHAGIADRRMWDAQVAAFSNSFTVVRYDMRGIGESTPPTAPFSHHDDLRQLLDALSIERANIAGLSMGASVAIDFALASPERVNRLVVSSVLGPPPRSQSLFDGWSAAEAAFERDGLPGVNEVEMQIWVDGPQRAQDDIARSIRDLVAAMNLPVLEAEESAEHESDPLEPPAHQRLASIQAPTLVITGDLDQPDVLDYTARLAQEIPGARREVVSGAAHMVNMEAPDQFNRLVVNFLTE
jgi:3-oxoadipate enol-lactonase